ncbi:MAG TPA: tetratricopeptide repeat protein [Planctomycetaceae bacterium]|jgi:tetratricopeptide (TPR) repeat protein|nr:tetratricopeptide repeat protein [Planctomycetaceae bacterium]
MNTQKWLESINARWPQKAPSPLILIAGATGFLFCLAVVAAASLILSRHHAAAAPQTSAVVGDLSSSTATGSLPKTQAASDATPPAQTETAKAALEKTSLAEADKQPNDAEAALPPANPNQPPALGVGNMVDRLDAPVAFPKGMLSFLKGLDLLRSFHPRKAIEAFGQAIEADSENADFYTARGAAFIVAEKMQEGLPDLERAMKLKPENVLASRLTRLAYLMLGDQLKASKFYGHGSTESLDFLIGEVGNGYGGRSRARQHRYQQDTRSQRQTSASMQKLRTVASTVAGSFQTDNAQSAQALFALGVEQLNSKDFAGARRSLHNVILNNPHDWTGRYYYARSLLGIGDPDRARNQLTYVLCWKRFLPEAFADRAMCAAKQNDLKRARADLETAKKLDPASVTEAESAVAQAQAQPTPAGIEKDAAAWDRLLATAKASPPFGDLTAAALALRNSVNARRVRADEIYQDRLHELAAVARSEPGNADRLADVAEFLRDNNDVPGLRVAPNGAVHYLRRQTEETALWELQLAFQLTGEGLNADPRHARSWAIRSGLLLHDNKLEEAEPAAIAAVRFGPQVIAGHMALSDCYKERASRLRARAAKLRTPKIGSRLVRVLNQSGRQIRTETETFLIPPSPEELAQAAECDRQASHYQEKEQGCLNHALACAKGTKDEPFYQALLLVLKQDFARARPWLEKAILEKPDDPKLHRSLSSCLRALGQEKEAIEEFSRAIDLQQTTGEVWLNLAWTELERSAWKPAREALLRARNADPSDARVAAYWGVLTEFDTTDGAGPEAGLQAALAQEEARARDNQTTYLPVAGPAIPLSPEDLGLTIMLRLKAARAVFHTKPEQAAEYYLANVAAERRLSEWNLAKSVFSAMLPLPNRDAKQASTPMPLVAVLKNNRIFAGQALLDAGRPKDAARQFAAAENFANRLPDGGTAYLGFELEPQYVPFRVSSMPIYVKLLNAASLVQQGMKDRARMDLQQVRFYLANRTQEQRAMQGDSIPGLYERLAPAVGLQ